jgi:hypothetical protein
MDKEQISMVERIRSARAYEEEVNRVYDVVHSIQDA